MLEWLLVAAAVTIRPVRTLLVIPETGTLVTVLLPLLLPVRLTLSLLLTLLLSLRLALAL